MKVNNRMELIAPFRIPGFSRLFIAALVSGLGGSLVPIAFALESHRIEPSGWGLTVVLLSLWLGRFIGMFSVQKMRPAKNPVRVMIGSDLVRFAAQGGLLGWMIFLGAEATPSTSIVALSLSSAIYGIALAFFQPARFTVIPKLIPEEQRGRVNSWLSILGDVFAVSGPLVGSVVVLTLGFQAVLLIDAIGFLVGIALLSGIRLAIPGSEENFSLAETEVSVVKRIKLPANINVGLLAWFFVALTIGFLGTAGPTLVIDLNSPEAWAVTAAFMAAGSLSGSASSLLGVFSSIAWKYIHLLCCVGISLQLVLFLFLPVPPILWAIGFLGAALTTSSGIRWDTLGQSVGAEAEVHAFATRDQIVSTAGIPIGMLLFGVSSLFNTTTLVVVIIVVATIGAGALAALTRTGEYSQRPTAFVEVR